MKKILLILIILNCFALQVSAQKVSINDAKKFIGKNDSITVCGKIFSARFLDYAKNTPTLLNVDGNFPEQKLTVVIFGEDRKNFPPNPERYFVNANVCISGVVINFNGKPEIIARKSNQIEIDASKTLVREKLVEKPVPDEKFVVNSKNTVKDLIPDLPKPTPVEEVKIAKPNEIIITTKLNLRSGPSADFPIVSTIPAGSSVNIIFSNKGWSQVSVVTKNTGQRLNGFLYLNEK